MKNTKPDVPYSIQDLRNEHDAEDVVQEAFISIAKNIDKFSDTDCHKTQKLIVIITD